MSERDPLRDRALSDGLRLLGRHLQLVHGGIVVAAAALHQQNADRDKEIAQVLEHLVGDRLVDQIERISRLLALAEASGSYPVHTGGRPDDDEAPPGVREPKVAVSHWSPRILQ